MNSTLLTFLTAWSSIGGLFVLQSQDLCQYLDEGGWVEHQIAVRQHGHDLWHDVCVFAYAVFFCNRWSFTSSHQFYRIQWTWFWRANSQVMMDVKSFMDKYGNNFRTFGHGALHGFISSVFCFTGSRCQCLFERRSWKYIMLHWGYWTDTLVLMGGLICAYQTI